MSKSLLDILEEDKISLQNRGAHKVALCPFHKEDTPSFTIYPTETYYCFGCNVWGDAVKWLLEYRGMRYSEALDYVGVDYKERRRSTRVIKVKNQYRLYPFLGEVAARYHAFLMQQPGAIKYLRSRGLSIETITKYKLGYTDGRVLNLQFAEEVAMAESVGLTTDKGYELMSHRITIPNLIKDNLCDFMIGRTVTNDKVKYLAIRTPKTIYGLFDQYKSPVLFMTEGQMDYLILRQWGYPAIVAGGTHISRSILTALRGRNIVLVPDNDPEGQKAAERLLEALGTAKTLDYKELGVKDVGELAVIPEGKLEFDRLVKEQFGWESQSTFGTI